MASGSYKLVSQTSRIRAHSPTPHKQSFLSATSELEMEEISPDRGSLRTDVLVASKEKRREQFWKILWRLLARLIIDAALWASFIVAVLYTEGVGSLTRSEKHIFNAVGVGLPLMLGLNYNSSFQAMAGIMRWKVLASGEFTLKEADLILSLDSFLTVFKLGIHWFKEILNEKRNKNKGIYLGRALACLGWVILTLGSQVGVGLLGLTFDFNSEDAFILENGRVWVTNLTSFLDKPYPTLNEEQYKAHQYGDLSNQLARTATVENVPDNEEPSYPSNITLYSLAGTNYWVYKLQDWTGTRAEPRQRSVGSSRTVGVRSNCTIYLGGDVGSGGEVGSGGQLNWTSVMIDIIAADGVTFLNFDPDGHQENSRCGSRCARIGGVSANWDKSQRNFTECDVTISTVNNASNITYEMTDQVAQLAAGAIAMDGIPREFSQNIPGNSYQFSRYNNGTPWGADFVDENEVARRVGMFAIGSIALLDFYGGTLHHEVQGRMVSIGVKLTAKQPQIWIVMGILFTVHLVLIPVVLLLGNSVSYIDGSHLSTAILLKPIVTAVERGRGLGRSKEYHRETTFRTSYIPKSKDKEYFMELTELPGRSPEPSVLKD